MRKEIFLCIIVILTTTFIAYAATDTLAIDGMEDIRSWGSHTGTETTLVMTEDRTYVKEGSKSLKLEYTGRSKGCNGCSGHIVFYQTEFSEWKNYEGITFWLYKPEGGIDTEVRVGFYEHTPAGKSVYYASRVLRTKGWHRIELPFTDFSWHFKSDLHLPFDLDNFNAFEMELRSNELSITGYIDDLKLLPTATTPTPTTTSPPTTTPAPTTTPPPVTTPAPMATPAPPTTLGKTETPITEASTKDIDWEQVGVILAIMGATTGGVLSRRKRSRVKKLLDDIDKAYESFKMNSRRCEAELYQLRGLVSEQLKNGKINEDSYSILDKRIDDYLSEIRERIMEEKVGSVPVRLKDEVHRMLQDGEISENEYKAFDTILGKSKDIGKKEKSDLKDLFEKWRDDDKITGSVLDKLIDEYIKDISKVDSKVSGLELKAEINKIMEDGIVTQEEYEEFTKMLDSSDLSEEEKEGLKRKLRKIRDLSNK